jgi:hypothetical protein
MSAAIDTDHGNSAEASDSAESLHHFFIRVPSRFSYVYLQVGESHATLEQQTASMRACDGTCARRDAMPLEAESV